MVLILGWYMGSGLENGLVNCVHINTCKTYASETSVFLFTLPLWLNFLICCIGRLQKSGGQKIYLISLLLNKFS